MWAQIDCVTSAADPVDVAVVWFRRDLRLHDHPALTEALASSGRVAPLFVVDPSLSRSRFTSPNRWWYLMGSLRDLNEALEQRGSRLIVRLGDPIAEVPTFARSIGAAAVYASREPLPYGRRRDDAVAAALERDGVDFRRHRACSSTSRRRCSLQRANGSGCSRPSGVGGRPFRCGRSCRHRPRSRA